MSALVRTEVSTAASRIPPERDYDADAHTLRIIPNPCCPSRHDARRQRSLPLFRVLHPRVAENPAPPVDRDSQNINAQQALADAQQVITVADHGTLFPVQPAALPSSRRQLWSVASVGLLRTDYPTTRLVRDISAELGRSVGAVYGKARRLGLKRPRRGAVLAEAPATPLVSVPVLDAPQPSVAPTPGSSPLTILALQPPLPVPKSTLAPKAERTKMGGRPGCWAEDDGALSERLERLFIANFSPGCIAAVLGVTERAVATRAWVVNCPRRDPQALRDDVEAARLVDRLAAPLPQTLHCWRTGKMLARKRCRRKGHFIWGTNGTTLSNDARRQRSYKILTANAPMHAW